MLRLPREIHSLKELKDDRHIHESSSYRDRLGVGIADGRKSNVSSKGATSSLRGLHPSLRCDDRKSGGVTARRNFNAGATSHDRNRTNDKRHKVYNRRDARQPPTALTALGVGQTISGSWSVPSRLIEVDEPFFAQGCHTTFGAHSTHRTRASWLRQLAALYVHVGCGVDEARRILRAVLSLQFCRPYVIQ